MTRRRSVLLIIVAVAAACASVTVPADPTDVSVLRATVNGRDAIAVDDHDIAPPRAMVRWWSFFGGEGGVAFLEDRTLCTRRPRSTFGISIVAERYAANDEIDIDFMKIDFAAAEERALEQGIALNAGETWLLTNPKLLPLATRAATALADARLVRRARIGVIDDDSYGRGVRLLLLPDGPPTSVTDALPLTIAGPVVADAGAALHVLLNGPETTGGVVFDGLEVTVSHGDVVRHWQAPREAFTERDAVWLSTLQHVASAIERGCLLSDP